jgi:phosphatidylglycerophosphate synthase
MTTARGLARSGISPNQISVLSVLFATLGAIALVLWPDWRGLLACAAGILLRLMCNLFDGMVAVEAGRGATPVGAIYNDVPDRITDSIFFIAVGFAMAWPWLGWLAALLAVFTAYIRALGGALGLPQDFRGPMAKPHRMWLLAIALVLAALVPAWMHVILFGAMSVVCAGSALTCALRLHAITAQLRAKA